MGKKKKVNGEGEDQKARMPLTLLGVGHKTVALNLVTICPWGT